MVSIRLAQEKDLPDLLEIYNDIILRSTAVYEYEPHTLAMRKNWLNSKSRDGFPVFAAEENNEVVGFSSYGYFRAWAAYKYSVENSVYVSEKHRGKGIGKMLLEPLIQSAREKNMHVIVASIDRTNTASLRLHKSFGFEEVACFKQVGYKFGRWLDLLFLELILETPLHPVEGQMVND
jgi:L-amino acid N-acyltransferase YncA